MKTEIRTKVRNAVLHNSNINNSENIQMAVSVKTGGSKTIQNKLTNNRNRRQT